MRSFSCGALTRSTPRHSFIPAHEPIDLINVGFENPRSLAGQFAQARQPKRFAGPPVAPAEARAPIDPYAVPDRLARSRRGAACRLPRARMALCRGRRAVCRGAGGARAGKGAHVSE